MEGNYEHCSGIYTHMACLVSMANIVGKYSMDVMLPLYENNCRMLYYLCIYLPFCTRWINDWSVRRNQSDPFFSVMKEAMLFVFATLLQCGNDTIKLKMHERVRGVSDKIGVDFVIPFRCSYEYEWNSNLWGAVAVILHHRFWHSINTDPADHGHGNSSFSFRRNSR